MRGILCLLILGGIFSFWKDFANSYFEGCPPNPPYGGRWVDSVLNDEDQCYELVGLSDLIVRDDKKNILFDIEKAEFKVSSGLYLTGAYQLYSSFFGVENSKDGKFSLYQRVTRIPLEDVVRIAHPPLFHWSDELIIEKKPNSIEKGVNHLAFKRRDIQLRFGINVIACEVAPNEYTYGYVLFLKDKKDEEEGEELKFAVFDIDDTAVLTRALPFKDMIKNCQTAEANNLILECAKFLDSQGYIIVYLSLRDYSLYALTREQLKRCGFPEGLLFLDITKIVDTWNDPPEVATPDARVSGNPFDAYSHKKEVLEYLSNHGKVIVGFGDNERDSAAYKGAEVPHRYQLMFSAGGDGLRNDAGPDYNRFVISYVFPYMAPSTSKSTGKVDLAAPLNWWEELKKELFIWEQHRSTSTESASGTTEAEPFKNKRLSD